MKKTILLILLICISCNKSTDPTVIVSPVKEKPIVATYQFQGIIIDIMNETQQMLIKHDEVPDFMMKMTMMFNIDSSINMNDYRAGDSLNFNFYISEQSEGPAKTWVNELRIINHRELTNKETYDDFFDQDGAIQIGEKLSDAIFLNLDNEEVKLSDWEDKFKFISFVFSRCPMPNFCPAVIMKNQYLINQFKNNGNVEFIIISFDYKYDQPKVLKKAYGGIFDNYNNIHFLSSYNHKEDITKITLEAGLGFSGIDDGDPRDIGHTLKSLLVSPDGILISSYGGDNWDPKQVEYDINKRLKTDKLD